MISIISGTNRSNSKTLLIAAYYKKLLLDRNCECQILDLSLLPKDFIFSALYDNQRQNKEFNYFIDEVNNSDKLVFIVPEYNGSFPGVLKAFIDGLDFPESLKNKKGALIGISSGVMAGALALSNLTDVLNYCGLHVLANKPRLPRIESLIMNGEIKDAALKKLLEIQAEELIAF